jgi:hypothetical protein
MTATGYIHYALDKKQTIPLVLGGAGFDGKYTEINYFVQYQKNNLSALDLFNTTGLNPRVFNYNKNYYTSY